MIFKLYNFNARILRFGNGTILINLRSITWASIKVCYFHILANVYRFHFKCFACCVVHKNTIFVKTYLHRKKLKLTHKNVFKACCKRISSLCGSFIKVLSSYTGTSGWSVSCWITWTLCMLGNYSKLKFFNKTRIFRVFWKKYNFICILKCLSNA